MSSARAGARDVCVLCAPKKLCNFFASPGENAFLAVQAAGPIGVGSLGLRMQQMEQRKEEEEEVRDETKRWKYRLNGRGQRGRQEQRQQRELHCMLEGNQVHQTDTGPQSHRWCLIYLTSHVAHIATCKK